MINPMRFSGLASGLDTESLVQKLMTVERMPLGRLEQQKQILEWRQSLYREVNSSLLAFRNQVFNMQLQGNLQAKQVVSSNDAKVSASAGSAAGNASYTITKAQLATSATNASSGGISRDPGNKVDATKSLWSQRDKFDQGINWLTPQDRTESISVTQDRTSFRLTKGAIEEGSTAIRVVDKDGVETTFQVYTDQAAFEADNAADTVDPKSPRVLLNTETGELTFNQTIKAESKIEAEYQYNHFEFSITTYKEGGIAVTETLQVDGQESLASVLARLSSSKAGVSAFYDANTDRISITRKETGNFNVGGEEISFDAGGFLNSTLKLDASNETGGTNAVFTINGLETERTSNTFSLGGVTFTLKGEVDASSPVTVNVSNNVDKSVEAIKGFVEKYNELIDRLNSLISEKRERKFQPLTSDQKREMSEKEIDLWEEKAKSGLLNGDPILRSTLSNLRSTLYSSVSGVHDQYNSLYSIGIKTGDYSEKGKLHIDEAKLRKALETNPDEVMKIFNNKSDNTSEKGVAFRLYENVDQAIKDLTRKAGSSAGFSKVDNSFIGKDLKIINDRMEAFQKKMVTIESRYWKQFSAMEKAIQRSNMQSGWLMQQFGGFGGGNQ